MDLNVSEPNVISKNLINPVITWDVELINFDLSSIRSELYRPDIWKSGNLQGNKRLNFENTDSSKLADFRYKFNDAVKNIIEEVYDSASHYLKPMYHKGGKHYSTQSLVETQLYKDLPGFEMGRHIDNRHIIFQLLLNLTDNNESTRFYSKQKIVCKASTKQYEGVIFVNSGAAFHDIDRITRDRYIAYTSVGFN